MSRRIHRKIPSPAPIAAAIEVARSGKKFRLPHNPRVTSVTHEIIKFQEKHRRLQKQLLTQYQWLLSSGIPIPSSLLASLQQQLSYNFTYTPANVLTGVPSGGLGPGQVLQHPHPPLFNFQAGTIDDISTQIYHQTQLINSIHQLTCHPGVLCHFDPLNPTVCLLADPLVINDPQATGVNNVTTVSSTANLPTSIASGSNSGHSKRGLPEPKCQCSLKSSPMHQLHQESCSLSKNKQQQQQQHQHQHHQHHQHHHHHQHQHQQLQPQQQHQSLTPAKSTNVHSTTTSTSATTSDFTSNAPTVTTSAMKPALSAKSRTVNPPNSIMPLASSDSQHQHHQQHHHHQHQASSSNHVVPGGGSRVNSLLPSTLQKVVKFNLNPSYSKGDSLAGKESVAGASSSSRPGYGVSLHHHTSVASSICKSLASGMTNAQVANRNRSRAPFGRTQSWEQVASLETGVDLDPDVLNRNKRNLPLVPSFKHPTSPTMPMAKMKLIKEMITGTDLNFRRKMQVSPVPRYSLEHELKFGPKASLYATDTLPSGASGSFIHSKLQQQQQQQHQASLEHPFHFASSSCNKQSGPGGQSNQSTRPSTPTYLMHDHHSHHLTGHHGHHSLSAHHSHSLQPPQVHHLHSSSTHAHHLRRPRSSIFSSLPGSPVHGFSRSVLFAPGNWRDDCYLPAGGGDHHHPAATSDRVHCDCCCSCNCCLSGEVCNDANCQCCNPYPGPPGLSSSTAPTVTSSVPDLRSALASCSFRPLATYGAANASRHGHISGSHMYHHLYSRHSSPPPPVSSLLHCDTCTNKQLTNCTHLSAPSVATSTSATVGGAAQFPSVSEITKPPFLDPTYNLIEKYDYNYDNYFKCKRDKLRPFFRSAPPSRSVTPNGLTVMSSYLTSSSTPVPPLINNSSSATQSAMNKNPGTGTLTINPSSSATIASTGSTSIVPAIANNKEIVDSPKVVFKNQLKYFVEERKNALATSLAMAAGQSASLPAHRSAGGSESNINALLNMYSNPPDPVKSKFPPAGASTYQSVPQGCIDPSSVTCFTPVPMLQNGNSSIGRRHSFNGPLGVGASANSSSNYLSHHPSYRPSPSPYPSFYSCYEPPPASSLLTSTAAAIAAGAQRLISSSNPDIPGSMASGGNLSRLDALTGCHYLTDASTGPLSYLSHAANYSSSVPTSKQATRASSPYPGHPLDVDSSHYEHRLPLGSSFASCSIPGCINCSHSAIQNNTSSSHHLSSLHTSSLHNPHHLHHTPVYGSSATHQRLPSHNISSSIDHLYNSSCINCPAGNNTLYGHTSHPHLHSYHSRHPHHHSHSHLLHHEASNLPPYNYDPTSANSLQQHSTNLKISKYL